MSAIPGTKMLCRDQFCVEEGSGMDLGWVDYPDPSRLNLVLGQFGNRYVE